MKTFVLSLSGATMQFNTSIQALDKEQALKIADRVYGYFHLDSCIEIEA